MVRILMSALGALLFLLAGFTLMNESTPHFGFVWFGAAMAVLTLVVGIPPGYRLR